MSKVLVLINSCARTTFACIKVSSRTFSGVVFYLDVMYPLGTFKQLVVFFQNFPNVVPNLGH